MQKARLYQILAILQKFCKMNTYTFNIHTNVVGGFILNEPATDLAVGVAIASSIKDRPVRSDIAFIGEIGACFAQAGPDISSLFVDRADELKSDPYSVYVLPFLQVEAMIGYSGSELHCLVFPYRCPCTSELTSMAGSSTFI